MQAPKEGTVSAQNQWLWYSVSWQRNHMNSAGLYICIPDTCCDLLWQDSCSINDRRRYLSTCSKYLNKSFVSPTAHTPHILSDTEMKCDSNWETNGDNFIQFWPCKMWLGFPPRRRNTLIQARTDFTRVEHNQKKTKKIPPVLEICRQSLG